MNSNKNQDDLFFAEKKQNSKIDIFSMNINYVKIKKRKMGE